MSENSSNSGSFAGALGGGALGASAAYLTTNAAIKNRGFIGGLADKAHQILGHLDSPEKIKKIASTHFDKLQKHIGTIEAQINSLPDEHLSTLFEIAEAQGLGGVQNKEELLNVLNQAKKLKIEDAPKEVWEQAHGAVKTAKSALEKSGVKRSLISHVPGGIHTLTGVGAVVGAALAYMAISDITKANAPQAGTEVASR